MIRAKGAGRCSRLCPGICPFCLPVGRAAPAGSEDPSPSVSGRKTGKEGKSPEDLSAWRVDAATQEVRGSEEPARLSSLLFPGSWCFERFVLRWFRQGDGPGGWTRSVGAQDVEILPFPRTSISSSGEGGMMTFVSHDGQQFCILICSSPLLRMVAHTGQDIFKPPPPGRSRAHGFQGQ